MTRLALGAVIAVLLTMPVFAFVARGRPVDVDVQRRPATVLLGTWIRDWVMWLITPVERALVTARVSPDVLNYLGAAMGFLAGVAYVRQAPAVAGWLVLLGGLADILDGRIARARGIASAYGEFLDSMLDRFAETFAFAGLAWSFVAWPAASAATTLALGASMLVSYARAKGDAMGVACRGGVMQRAERLVLLAVASLADGPATNAMHWRTGTVLAVTVAVIAVGALATAVYRTAYIARSLRIRTK